MKGGTTTFHTHIIVTSKDKIANNTQTHTDTQTYIPGDGAVAFNLTASDEVPDAGHPVSEQGERGHEQRQDHGAVLGVAVQLLQEAQETQEAHRLQQVNPKVLGEE